MPPPPQQSLSRTLSSQWPQPAGLPPPPLLPPRHSELGWAVLPRAYFTLQWDWLSTGFINCEMWLTPSRHVAGNKREKEKNTERGEGDKKKDLNWDRHLPNFIINTVFRIASLIGELSNQKCKKQKGLLIISSSFSDKLRWVIDSNIGIGFLLSFWSKYLFLIIISWSVVQAIMSYKMFIILSIVLGVPFLTGTI